jgi:transcriptional regulator with XRE-family HTH domain
MKDLTQQIYKTYNLGSEAELARLLGISPQAMNEYNSGRSKFFSDEVAYRIARLSNKNPAYVFLLREHQRAKDQRVKVIWKDLLTFSSKSFQITFTL